MDMTNGSPQRVRLTTAMESGEQYRIQLPRSHSFLDDGALGTATPHQCSVTSPITAAAAAAAAKSLQSCPTLCDPIDGSPPGSPVPGTLQARTLEWVVISIFSCNVISSVQRLSHV